MSDRERDGPAGPRIHRSEETTADGLPVEAEEHLSDKMLLLLLLLLSEVNNHGAARGSCCVAEHVMRGDAVERRRKVAAVDLLGLENDSRIEELAAAAAASICDGQQLSG